MKARAQQMLIVGGVALGGLLLWMFSKSSAASAATLAAGTAGSGPANLPGPTLAPITLPSGIYSAGGSLYQSALPAPTSAQVSQQGAIWANLQPTSAPVSSGWVNFPSGSQAAASLLPWRTDGSNFYTNWAGVVFAVPLTADQYGNYTAVQA